MINKLKDKLLENKGASVSIGGVGVSFIIVFIVYLLFIICTIISLVLSTRSIIEESTISIIQNNYENVYHTSRESYSGGYLPDKTGFFESVLINKNELYDALINNLGLKKTKAGEYSNVDKMGNIIYTIKDLEIDIVNDGIGSGTQDFKATVGYKFSYPIHIFNLKKDVDLKLKVYAKYTSKF